MVLIPLLHKSHRIKIPGVDGITEGGLGCVLIPTIIADNAFPHPNGIGHPGVVMASTSYEHANYLQLRTLKKGVIDDLFVSLLVI